MRRTSSEATSRKLSRNSGSASRSGRSWRKVFTETSGFRISWTSLRDQTPDGGQAVQAADFCI